MRRYRCDVLGPGVNGLRPRWIYGTTTDLVEAERQFDGATAARLVTLSSCPEGWSPVECDVRIKGLA